MVGDGVEEIELEEFEVAKDDRVIEEECGDEWVDCEGEEELDVLNGGR